MIARRALLTAPAVLATRPVFARAAPDEDMPREPWFIDSFLDLRDDLAAATAAGKRLAVAWELRGCPPCIALHRLTRRQNIAGPPTFQNFDPAGREARRLAGFVPPAVFLAAFRAAAGRA